MNLNSFSFGSMLHNLFKIPRRQNCCDCCWCMEVRPSSEFFEIFPSRHHPMKGDEHSVRVFCFRQGSSLYRVLLDFSRASKICFLSPLRRWYGRLNPALSTLFRVPGGISFEEIETFRANTTTSLSLCGERSDKPVPVPGLQRNNIRVRYNQCVLNITTTSSVFPWRSGKVYSENTRRCQFTFAKQVQTPPNHGVMDFRCMPLHSS